MVVYIYMSDVKGMKTFSYIILRRKTLTQGRGGAEHIEKSGLFLTSVFMVLSIYITNVWHIYEGRYGFTYKTKEKMKTLSFPIYARRNGGQGAQCQSLTCRVFVMANKKLVVGVLSSCPDENVFKIFSLDKISKIWYNIV